MRKNSVATLRIATKKNSKASPKKTSEYGSYGLDAMHFGYDILPVGSVFEVDKSQVIMSSFNAR